MVKKYIKLRGMGSHGKARIMSSIENFLHRVYAESALPSFHQRRKALILEMASLEQKNVACFTCPGTCCTSQANSMQITPIEAIEILHGLKVDQFSPTELVEFRKRMKDTINAYRLNVEIYTGKKNSSALRKNYTCPFFNNGSLGCGLSRSTKPYGCLGFNPKTSEDNGQSCASNTELLSDREESFAASERLVCEKIKNELSLSWSKQNIPQALLDVLDNFFPIQ